MWFRSSCVVQIKVNYVSARVLQTRLVYTRTDVYAQVCSVARVISQFTISISRAQV